MFQSIYIFYGGFQKNAGGAFLHSKTLNDFFLDQNFSSKIITLDNLPILVRYLPHLAFRLCLLIYPPYAFHVKGKITGYLYKTFFAGRADTNIFEDIYLAWESSKPSLIILHAVWSDNLHSFALSEKAQKKLKQFEEETILTRSIKTFTVSEQYRSYLVEDHFDNLRLDDIGVIPLGRDLPEDTSLDEGHTENKKTIVAMGLLEKRKNFRFLLHTFKEIHTIDHEYKLTILGADGGELSFLKEYARKHKLPVAFLGKLGYRDALNELRKHHIYLHTSSKESFSYSLLEAKLLNCVTIALGDLQVPEEFIDIKLPEFDRQLWTKAVFEASGVSSDFQNNFSVDAMGKKTVTHLRLGLNKNGKN